MVDTGRLHFQLEKSLARMIERAIHPLLTSLFTVQHEATKLKDAFSIKIKDSELQHSVLDKNEKGTATLTTSKVKTTTESASRTVTTILQVLSETFKTHPHRHPPALKWIWHQNMNSFLSQLPQSVVNFAKQLIYSIYCK